jgi:hypothetical protein
VPSAEALLRLGLCYGLGKLSLRNTAAWADATAVATVSDVAVLKRLRGAAAWFGQIVQAQLAAAPSAPAMRRWAGRRLRLADGTTVSHPGSGAADWRLHVAYDLASERFDFIHLTDRSVGESLDRLAWQPGDIALGDRGFAKAGGLRAVVACGADVLVRIGWNALTLHQPDGPPFDLFAALRALPDDAVADLPVVAPGRKPAQDLPLRLIAKRKTAAEAERSRAKLRRRASKKGHRLDPRSVEAAGYIFVVTSLPHSAYPAAQVLDVYRLRWQIEIAFKRLKGLVRIDELPAKDPDLARAWLYCNLIAALLIDQMTRQVRDSFPCASRRAQSPTLALATPAIGVDGSAARPAG